VSRHAESMPPVVDPNCSQCPSAGGTREVCAKILRGYMADDVDGGGYKRGGVGERPKIGVFEVALLLEE
jgi:hypothetical protein